MVTKRAHFLTTFLCFDQATFVNTYSVMISATPYFEDECKCRDINWRNATRAFEQGSGVGLEHDYAKLE